MKLTTQQRFDLALAAFKGAGDICLYALAIAGIGVMFVGQPSRKPVVNDNSIAVARAHAPVPSQSPTISTSSDIFPFCPPFCPRDGKK